MGASVGTLGTARAQYHLRQVFVFLNMHAFNQPEVMISNAGQRFDAQGHLTDTTTQKIIRQLLRNLVDWTRQLQGARREDMKEDTAMQTRREYAVHTDAIQETCSVTCVEEGYPPPPPIMKASGGAPGGASSAGRARQQPQGKGAHGHRSSSILTLTQRRFV